MAHHFSRRQLQLLTEVVEAFVKTCTPVGSKLIARQSGVTVSPATIRNDLAELESAGYLSHPYTSAGRVPTAAGYQYYVDHAMGAYRMTPAEQRALAVPTSPKERRLRLKAVAKNLAELSASCVVVGFSAHDVYYTGLSNLFVQPEFRDYQFSFSMSEVIDHLDEVMATLYAQVVRGGKVQILIGNRNPFGSRCSVLVVRCGDLRSAAGVLGVLGPWRMDYPRNVALLEYACQVTAA